MLAEIRNSAVEAESGRSRGVRADEVTLHIIPRCAYAEDADAVGGVAGDDIAISALVMAARRLPVPESLVFLTMKVAGVTRSSRGCNSNRTDRERG